MKRIALVAATVLALVLAAWLAFDDAAPIADSARPAAERTAESDASAAPPRLEAVDAASAQADAHSPEREAIEVAAQPRFSFGPARSRLVGELRNAAGGEPPREADVSLLLPSGRRTATYDSANARFEFDDLDPGEWPLQIRAKGFHDLDEVVALGRGATTEDNFKLWPLNWILVRAVTEDGQPYGWIAHRLGLGPSAVFEGGFQVWATTEAPADELGWPSTPPLEAGGDFSSASTHYERLSFDTRDVARVRRNGSGSMWIALAFHGRFFGWAHIPPQVNVAQFEIAAQDITSQFGSLSFCAVDATSKAPLLDARASLEAEVSGLRRDDTSDLVCDDLGCFIARPLVPGEYDLAVRAPGRGEHHQRVKLHPGERLELGKIELDFAQQLEIRVLDEEGQPVLALVQLGAWRAGAMIEDCVTPRASTTGDGGRIEVAMPTSRTVVRAQRLGFAQSGQLAPHQVGEAVVQFDPDSRATRLEIRMTPTQHAVVVAPAESGAATELRVLNAFQIGLQRTLLDRSRECSCSLAPGAYYAVLLDSAQVELARYPFDVSIGGLRRIEL